MMCTKVEIALDRRFGIGEEAGCSYPRRITEIE
jgi:hypothetical protein